MVKYSSSLICILLQLVIVWPGLAMEIPKPIDEYWDKGINAFANYEYVPAITCFQASKEIIAKYYLARIYFGDFQVNNIDRKTPPPLYPHKAIELLKKYLEYEKIKALHDKYAWLAKDKNALCQFYFDRGNYDEAVRIKRTICQDKKELRQFEAKCNYYKGIEMGLAKPVKEAKRVLGTIEVAPLAEVAPPAEVAPQNILAKEEHQAPIELPPPTLEPEEIIAEEKKLLSEKKKQAGIKEKGYPPAEVAPPAVEDKKAAEEMDYTRLFEERRNLAKTNEKLQQEIEKAKFQVVENDARREMVIAEWQAIKEERKVLEQEKARVEAEKRLEDLKKQEIYELRKELAQEKRQREFEKEKIEQERAELAEDRKWLDEKEARLEALSKRDKDEKSILIQQWKVLEEARERLDEEKALLKKETAFEALKAGEIERARVKLEADKEAKIVEDQKQKRKARQELAEEEKRLLEVTEQLKQESKKLKDERVAVTSELKQMNEIKNTLDEEKKKLKEKEGLLGQETDYQKQEQAGISLEEERAELQQAIGPLAKQRSDSFSRSPSYQVVVISDKAIIWNRPARPNTTYKPIAEAKKGSLLVVLEKTTRWYFKVKLEDGTIGWVCSALIE